MRPFPDLATRMAATAFTAAMERWALSDGSADPHELTVRAFAMLEPALNAYDKP